MPEYTYEAEITTNALTDLDPPIYSVTLTGIRKSQLNRLLTWGHSNMPAGLYHKFAEQLRRINGE